MPKYQLYNHKGDSESFQATCIHRYHKGFFFLPKPQQIQNRKVWLDLFLLIKYFMAVLKRIYLYISVHNIMLVKIGDGLTDIFKIGFYLFFCGKPVSYFLKQSSSISVLKYHKSEFLFSINVIPKQFDDIGMAQFLMEDNLIDSRLPDLFISGVTILTATLCPVWRSSANLTCPQAPKPTATEWLL